MKALGDSTVPDKVESRSDIFFMLISAAVFAYFGFGGSWSHKHTTTQPPQLLPMVALLEWTLKAGAVACGLSALLVMLKQHLGDVLYAAAGLVIAVIFAVVAIWEWTNPQGYYSGIPAFLLIIFALWNGFGSWSSMREIMASRRVTTA